MKQKAQTAAPKKTNGAQSLLNFVRTFTDDKGRAPKLRELPVKKATVDYHFGSYETLLRQAKIGEGGLPLRKVGKVRYCRYCGKRLPRTRWFFCPTGYKENKVRNNCQEKYKEKHNTILSEEEIKRKVKKVYRKMWHKCKDCSHKCKIYLPRPRKEPPCVFICRADPEYEEASRSLTNG